MDGACSFLINSDDEGPPQPSSEASSLSQSPPERQFDSDDESPTWASPEGNALAQPLGDRTPSPCTTIDSGEADLEVLAPPNKDQHGLNIAECLNTNVLRSPGPSFITDAAEEVREMEEKLRRDMDDSEERRKREALVLFRRQVAYSENMRKVRREFQRLHGERESLAELVWKLETEERGFEARKQAIEQEKRRLEQIFLEESLEERRIR